MTATNDLSQSTDAARPKASARGRLSVMMFLELFIWGAWLPKIFGYMNTLGYEPWQQGLILNAFAFASFTTMFFSAQFADRNFAAEKFLAFSHLVGGVSIIALTWVTDFWPFFVLMLVHCLFYVPTMSITNSIAFANLKDAQNDFGRVRLWGTIGWIAASWPFVFILRDETAAHDVRYTYLVAGIASLALAAFSLKLPHTPPKPPPLVDLSRARSPAEEGAMHDAATSRFAWLEALSLLKFPFIAVLFVVTFIDSAVHQCYFIFTDTYLTSIGIAPKWVMPVMSIGQVAEIGTMAVLGYFLKRLGWRYTMVLGILGHAVRFALFAWAPYPAVAIAVNLLHGVCYAFFFATVYIFVDEFFPKDARTSAQGLFNFLILGVGPLFGNTIWPLIGNHYKTEAGYAFDKIFLYPSGVAVVAAAALFLFFHPPRETHPDKVRVH